MKKKNFIYQMLCLVLLLGAGTNVCAQDTSNFVPSDFQGYYFSPQNLGFATPQTAEFVQYGNTNINYYNGLLDLDIPLMNYKDPAFELDVSIKYISDGFKPGRRPSVVGNNWVLNVGGSITRNVMGTPDDIQQDRKTGLLAAIRNGKFKQYSKEDLLNLNISTVSKNRVFPEPEYDMAPDIFEFNFGHHKGRFIIDNTGNAKSLSGGGYKIDLGEMTIQEYSTNAEPKRSTIKITTPDGYLYTFGGTTSELEYSIPNNPDKLEKRPVQITSWYLSSIKDETRNNVINFSYKSCAQKNKYRLFVNSAYSGTQTTNFTADNQGHIPPPQTNFINSTDINHFLMEDKIYTPILKSIDANGTQIIFTTQTFPINFFGDTDGNDLIYLSGITTTHGHVVRSCKFNYQTLGKYFFLKKVELYDQSESPAIYSFDYDQSRSLPDPLTTSVDHWGFWNGGNEAIDNAQTYLYDGNFEQRKATNTSVSTCTMLTKITYPTKGCETIEYEYNRYKYYLAKSAESFVWNSIAATNVTLFGGVRIKKLTLLDPDTGKKRQRSFSYLDSKTGLESGRINELPRYSMPVEKIQYINFGTSINVSSVNSNISTWSMSSNSIGRLNNISEFPIGYSHITETFDDGSFCRYYFSSLADVPDDANLGTGIIHNLNNIISRSFNLYQKIDKALNYAPNPLTDFRGKLLSKETYNNRNKKVAAEEYFYNSGSRTANYEVSIANKSGAFLANKIFTTPCLLTQEKLTDENGVTVFHNYKYNDGGFVTEKETINSNGDHVYLKYTHPGEASNLPSTIYNDYLINANRIEEPVSILKYLKKPQDEKRKIVDFIYFLYNQTSNAGTQKRTLWGSNLTQLLPEDTDLTSFNSDKILFIEAYDNYDKYGNVVTLRDANGNVTLYLWSYNGQYVIAEIKGSTYEEVKFVLVPMFVIEK